MSVPVVEIYDIVLDGSGAAVIALNHPSRSFIQQMIAVSAADHDFTLELFTSDPTQSPASASVENYRVCPLLTSSSGKIANYPFPPLLFVNKDLVQTIGNPPRIYVRIAGGGAADTITLTLGSYNNVGGV